MLTYGELGRKEDGDILDYWKLQTTDRLRFLHNDLGGGV